MIINTDGVMKMEVRATSKYAKISPSKAFDFARRLKGLPVSEALKITDFTKRKAATLIGKTLKSAIANAEHNSKLSVNDLHVKEAIIGIGPTSSRFWPKARGMWGAATRKTCHIKIVLSDGKI